MEFVGAGESSCLVTAVSVDEEVGLDVAEVGLAVAEVGLDVAEVGLAVAEVGLDVAEVGLDVVAMTVGFSVVSVLAPASLLFTGTLLPMSLLTLPMLVRLATWFDAV